MTILRRSFHTTREDRGERLDQVLPRAIEGISRRHARRLIDRGAVYVDGKRVRVASRRLDAGARVEAWIEEDPATPSFTLETRHILYEDDVLIAVDKPPGLPSQAAVHDAVHCLEEAVRRHLAEREGDGAPYLALHHRLDRGTSGVLVFAKHRAANHGLAEAFRERRVRKVYHALTVVALETVDREHVPDTSWVVSDRLDVEDGRAVRVESGGRTAETEIRPLQVFPGALWVEAIPRTGRMHQIRIHLAMSGFPVLGDTLYGKEAAARLAAPRLMLHAQSLTLAHPVSGEALCIESPLPEDFRRQVAVLAGPRAPKGGAAPTPEELSRLLADGEG